MRRLLPLFVPLMLALAPTAPAAPVPKHLMKDRPTYYHPTTVGSRWVYESGGSEWPYVVTKVADHGDMKVVTVEWDLGEKNRGVDAVLEVSPKGLFRTHSGPVKLTEPDIYLKQPFKVGDKWEFDNPGAKGKDAKGNEVVISPFRGTTTIAAVEKVTVPAGTFEAVRVDVKCTIMFDGKPSKWEASTWYAPGIGPVKVTGENGWVIRQLKSFTPGKE